jgi:hypothetical protein
MPLRIRDWPWSSALERRAAYVAASGPSLGRKRPRRAAIAGDYRTPYLRRSQSAAQVNVGTSRTSKGVIRRFMALALIGPMEVHMSSPSIIPNDRSTGTSTSCLNISVPARPGARPMRTALTSLRSSRTCSPASMTATAGGCFQSSRTLVARRHRGNRRGTGSADFIGGPRGLRSIAGVRREQHRPEDRLQLALPLRLQTQPLTSAGNTPQPTTGQ